MKALLEKLNIQDVNAGICTGVDGWITDPDGKELVSYNPTTGKPIAKVIMGTAASYDKVVDKAAESFKTWRTMPAPQRGQIVRDIGLALREYKEPLGELVTLEVGKIRTEGLGEVQEMIDICDFAVGLSISSQISVPGRPGRCVDCLPLGAGTRHSGRQADFGGGFGGRWIGGGNGRFFA